MSPTDELPSLLKKLRLSGLLATLQLRVEQAVGAIVGIKGPLVELRGLRDGRIGLS
jgi:hypothetical protein